ncbi:MAG: hypothetical protein RLZ98_3337 [Pseudomonadota bacterium]
MIRLVSVTAALAIGATLAFAQGSPIEQRQASMKAMSKVGKAPGMMAKGEAPFDLAAVKTALKTFSDEAKKSKDLYPDGSDKGETRAKAEIWQNKSEFLAKFDKLAADADKAAAAITDEASFKKEYAAVTKNCGGCHKPYRAPKK